MIVNSYYDYINATGGASAANNTGTMTITEEAGSTAPEPASCALLGGGLVGLAVVSKRRRAALATAR